MSELNWDWVPMVALIAALINIALIAANYRTMREYKRMLIKVMEREYKLAMQTLELRERELAVENKERELDSGYMPDMREYLEEIAH